MIIEHFKGYFDSKEKIITTLSMIAIASGMTALINSSSQKEQCIIDKPAFIHFKNQDIKQGILHSIENQSISLKEIQQNSEDPTTDTLHSFSLDQIHKIIFYGNEESFSMDLKQDTKKNFYDNFIGNYKINVGGHEGYLSIYYTKSGYPGGYIKFPKWGKGEIELLQYMEFQGHTIKFVRSCSGASCKEIGSPYEFKQTFIGSFNERGELEGKYSGTHSSGQWKAIRIR